MWPGCKAPWKGLKKKWEELREQVDFWDASTSITRIKDVADGSPGLALPVNLGSADNKRASIASFPEVSLEVADNKRVSIASFPDQKEGKLVFIFYIREHLFNLHLPAFFLILIALHAASVMQTPTVTLTARSP